MDSKRNSNRIVVRIQREADLLRTRVFIGESDVTAHIADLSVKQRFDMVDVSTFGGPREYARASPRGLSVHFSLDDVDVIYSDVDGKLSTDPELLGSKIRKLRFDQD